MLSVVIPSPWPERALCRSCVAAVEETLSVPHETIVVSTGGVQSGFTSKVNEGLRRAQGEHIAVVTDDVTVLEGWWPPLQAALDAGARVVFPDTIEGYMRHDFPAWLFAMTRQTLEDFSVNPGEFLDETMSLWYSDTDLHKRLLAANVLPLFVPESRILHGLSKTLADPEHKAWTDERIALDHAAFRLKWGQ